jgi:hypothetical protein
VKERSVTLRISNEVPMMLQYGRRSAVALLPLPGSSFERLVVASVKS